MEASLIVVVVVTLSWLSLILRRTAITGIPKCHFFDGLVAHSSIEDELRMGRFRIILNCKSATSFFPLDLTFRKILSGSLA